MVEGLEKMPERPKTTPEYVNINFGFAKIEHLASARGADLGIEVS